MATEATYWPWFFRPAGQLAVTVGAATLFVTESFEPEPEPSDEVFESFDAFEETGTVVGTLECELATP